MRNVFLIVLSAFSLIGKGQQINYTYTGGNGSAGLSEYGIVTQANAGQALLGAEGNGDIYANLNLGTNISGTRRFWHISKRPSGDGHGLHFFYFNGSTFQTPNLALQPGGNVGIGTITPGFRFHIRGGNPNTDAMTLGSTTTGNFALTSADGGAYGLFGGVSNTGRAWLQAGRYDSNFAYDLLLQASGGNVGIGTTNPYSHSRLHIKAPTSSPWGIIAEAYSNDKVIGISHDGTRGVIAVSSFASGFSPLELWTSNVTRMTITTDGNVGIGTASPNQKLTVNGTIYGKEVKVDLAVPGPDYVFEENYKLPSLEEIKTYIDQHKHLPEVPSAKEMEANGINVGEMNMILLKKVEELTLMLIEQKKLNDEQNKNIDLLNKRISTLEQK